MITKSTIVDQIEITSLNVIQVRFGLLLLEDGVQLDCKWHRTAFEPGVDIDAQIAAVNQHLEEMGKLPVPEEGTSRIKDVASAVWAQ